MGSQWNYNHYLYLTNISSSFSTGTSMATRTGFRSVLGDITKQQNIPQKVAVVEAKVTTRLASVKRPRPDAIVPAGQEGLAVERSLPAGVVDIDEKDFENPQLCAEYSQDVYAYLRSVEPFSAVKANHLIGCSINEKMRLFWWT